MVLDSPFTAAGSAGVPVPDASAFGAAVDQMLARVGAAPRLLAFGEALHGEEEFPRLRNALFAHLVEHSGYRSVAIESACLRGRLVDAYVHAGRGDLDVVMRDGFSHGFGDSPANRHLVRWMAGYNRSRPAGDRLRFLGFDAPMEMTSVDSPRAALSLAHTYLRSHLAEDLPATWDRIGDLLGDDGRWTDPAAAMDPSRSVGSSAEVRELRLIVEDVRLLLAGEAPRLLDRSSPEQLWDAELGARTAAGLLAYHAGMASESPRRMARLLPIRETMMADNLCAWAAREARRGPTLVFAHNQHVHRGTTAWRLGGMPLRWYSAGALVGARIGDAYAVLGSAVGTAPHQGIADPAPDTVEGRLAALSLQARLVVADDLAGALDGAGEDLRQRPRKSNNHTYFPLDPGGLRGYDAILFLPTVTDDGPGTSD